MASFKPLSSGPLSSADTGSGATVNQPPLAASVLLAAATIVGGAFVGQPAQLATANLAVPSVSAGGSVEQSALNTKALLPDPTVNPGTISDQPKITVSADFADPSILAGANADSPAITATAAFNEQIAATSAIVGQGSLLTQASFTAPLIANGDSVSQTPLSLTATFSDPSVIGGANVAQTVLPVVATLPDQVPVTAASVQQPTFRVTTNLPEPAMFVLNPALAQPFRTYLVEFDHHDGNVLQTTRLTSGYGYRSASSDTPALAAYDPRLQDAGTFQVTAFEPGKTVGRATIDLGEISMVNVDGEFDGIIDDAFDGRDVRIIQMPNEDDPLDQGVRLATLTMQQTQVSTKSLTLRLRNRLGLLDTDIQDNTFAGTTTSGTAGNAEGDSQLRDRIKPLVFGRVFNITPPPADRFNLIYQASDVAVNDITAVYDKGIELLDPDTNQSTLTDLKDATVQSARFQTTHSIGMFKLGAPADGQITADVAEGSTASDRTAAQVTRRILLNQTDLTTSDLDDTTFSDLDAKNSAEVGIFIGRQRRVIDVVSDVLSSVGAFLTAKRNGQFAVYRLDLPGPDDTPVQTYDEHLIFERDDLERVPTGDEGRGIPAWKINLNYKRNWTVQGSDQLAGRAQSCLGEDRKQFLRTEFQEIVKTDPSVKNKHKRPAELTFNTLLTNRTAAEAEAQRRLDIFSRLRERYQFRVKADFFDGVDLNDTIQIKFPRFGLDDGKLFKVIGYTYDFEQDVVSLDVWGGVEPV